MSEPINPLKAYEVSWFKGSYIADCIIIRSRKEDRNGKKIL